MPAYHVDKPLRLPGLGAIDAGSSIELHERQARDLVLSGHLRREGTEGVRAWQPPAAAAAPAAAPPAADSPAEAQSHVKAAD
jgi:hypothetical protein